MCKKNFLIIIIKKNSIYGVINLSFIDLYHIFEFSSKLLKDYWNYSIEIFRTPF